MATHQSIRAIAIMPNLHTVGQAVDQLVLAGFPLGQIFVVGRDTRSLTTDQPDLVAAVPIKELLHQVNVKTMTHTAGDRKIGRTIGSYTGAVTGLCTGLGLLAIPGVGEVVLGTVALYLISLTGIGTLAGGMLGGAVSQRMTRRLLDTYLMHVLQGNYLLLVSGSDTAMSLAESILSAQGIQGSI
jgi:hypothetical protein